MRVGIVYQRLETGGPRSMTLIRLSLKSYLYVTAAGIVTGPNYEDVSQWTSEFIPLPKGSSVTITT
jgi:hypothetical protein